MVYLPRREGEYVSLFYLQNIIGAYPMPSSDRLSFIYAHAAIKHRCALAPPFFPQRKGGKKRQGGNPLNPQVTLSIFFSGKSTRTILPKPTRIKRGPGAPGVRLCAGLKTCDGPKTRSPLCIVGFYYTAGEVLLKREPTGSPGVRGNPGGVFASFCRRGQKEVAAHWTVFLPELRSLCADKP